MYIIEVIPLTILPQNVPQLLSYFFNEKLEKGAIVEVPIGSRKIPAAVVASNPLEDQKILLKKTDFQLKKIYRVVDKSSRISSQQFKIALWLSRYYYAPLGYCLKTVLPPFFLKKGYDVAPPKEENGAIKRKPLFLLFNATETLTNIMPFIKKATEELGQIALIVPDASTLQYFYKELSATYNVVMVNSGLNNKKLYDAWQKTASGKADVVLGTRQALFMPFKNLKLILVNDVLHEFYKSDMTPKYNTPELAKMIADLHGARTVFISPVSGVEYYYRLKNKEFDFLDTTRPREPIKVVNMISELKSGNFSMFSRELKTLLFSTITQDKNKKILIFSPRRGHSGVLVCQNCGYTAKCPNCNVAFRVHKTTDLTLVCHHCSANQKMPAECSNCKSFKLKTVGPAGTQKIYEELQKLIQTSSVGKVPMLVLDADTVKNETEEEEIIKEVMSTRTSIIIATQMIFSHRYDMKFDLIGLLNTDSLINTPDFRTEENLFYQIERLFDFLPAQAGQPENMVLQTYNPENQAIVAASQGNYKQFYKKELEIRKAFDYPPYSRLVKLTYKHKSRDKASYEARVLSGKLKMAIGQLGLAQKVKMIDSYPSSIEKERNFFIYNIVLKVLPGLQDLRDILKFVPSNWHIDVNPRSII